MAPLCVEAQFLRGPGGRYCEESGELEREGWKFVVGLIWGGEWEWC